MIKPPDKPPLTLVGTADIEATAPSRPLGAHGRALWDKVQREYAIVDVGGREILTQICQALDQAESLAERIRTDGNVIYSRGVPRAHPALRDELHCRAFVVRSLERLGLNIEPVKPPGGQPKPSGWVPPR